MSDGMESIIPTIIGGAVAIKLLDEVTGKPRTVYIHVHDKHHKAKKKKKLRKVI